MIEVTINIRDENDDPVLGLTGSNIKFKTSPGGVEITGLTVYEQGLGTYVITGFTTWQKTQLFINGVLQNWWGIQYTGEPSNQFIDKTGDTMTGELSMGGQTLSNPLDPSAGTHVGDRDYNDSRYLVKNVAQEHQNGIGFRNTLPRGYNSDGVTETYLEPTENFQLTPKQYVDTMIGYGIKAGQNLLIVDPHRSEDITGYVYRNIRDAIDYAYSQTPSSANRWTVFVMPNKNPDGYTTDLTLYDYIDLIGLGMIKLNCSITRSGSMSDKNCRIENFMIELTDKSISVKKSRVINCIFKTTEDNVQTNISIEGSQLKDCGLFLFGSGVVESIPHGGIYNRFYNCFGNYNITFDANDQVIDYNYNANAEYQY
jgi:hypothetical protein